MKNVRARKFKARSVVAVAALLIGLTGATAAAAAQVGLNWTGTFQAGATSVTADCQPSGETITASFDTPTFVQGTLPWTVANVKFAGVNDACKTLKYEAAYKTKAGDWVKLGAGTVSGSTISQSITAGLDVQTIDKVALTIYS